MRERKEDDQRLARALDEVMRVVEVEIPPNDPEWIALVKVKLEAARQLVPLLERRSRLLGLDAPEQKGRAGAEGTEPGSLAELERKLQLVGPGGR